MMKKLSDYRFLVGNGVKALMAELSAKKRKDHKIEIYIYIESERER